MLSVIVALALPALGLAQPSPASPEPTAAPALNADTIRRLAGDLLPEDVPLGISREHLARIRKDTHILPWVANAFADAGELPRRTAGPARELTNAGTSLARSAEILLGIADLSSARTFSPAKDGWGVDWLADTATPGEVLRAVDTNAAQRFQPRFEALSPDVQRFIARVVVAAVEAETWAIPESDRAHLAALAALPFKADHRDRWYALATAPWSDTHQNRLSTRSTASFRMLAQFDRAYVGYAAMTTLHRLEFALDQAKDALAAASTSALIVDGPPIDISTRFGLLRIAGPNADTHDTPAWLCIDLGGDDTYTARFGASLSPGSSGILIDIAGNDRYTSDLPGNFACGLFGLGILIDLAGNDTYAAGDSSLACAWFGVGLLADFAGNDTYAGKRWTQGFAVAGAALLIDHAGDDSYTANYQSQGAASTLGAAALVDRDGHDAYTARDDGNVSAMYLNQSVAMSQGCGFGRRADTTDGHSLAGGIGILADARGDDHYHAQVWAQGCGFWWAVGALHDFAGNDKYRNGKYSAGAAAHFAIGVHIDHLGDDTHNSGEVDNPTAVNQYQGHARDAAISLFADLAGNDRYMLRNHCGGSADLSSLAIFYEHDGDDHYEYRPSELPTEPGWADTPPLGTTTATKNTLITPDRPRTTGIFIDAGGNDRYIGLPTDRANNARWHARRSADALGIGVDLAAPPDTRSTAQGTQTN